MLTIRRINADLADSVTALTAALAADLEAMERYVTSRADSGRQVWHTRRDVDTAAFTSALVAEIQPLIASTLHALRTGAIVDPAARLSAYEAIDLAQRRAADAACRLRTQAVAHAI
jgi:hypothetical protein